MDSIQSLQPHQVFVFGSNASGFHGAGAAGFACRGDAQNNWRNDPWFLRALETPLGSPERVGKWAVLGVPRGFQQGREGCSYAIETVVRPGKRRGHPLPEIEHQVIALCRFAKEHPHLEFLVTEFGTGLAGYTAAELRACFAAAFQVVGRERNLLLPRSFHV